ncbi:hypothetical protein Emed_004135 [Eimeria media]
MPPAFWLGPLRAAFCLEALPLKEARGGVQRGLATAATNGTNISSNSSSNSNSNSSSSGLYSFARGTERRAEYQPICAATATAAVAANAAAAANAAPANAAPAVATSAAAAIAGAI